MVSSARHSASVAQPVSKSWLRILSFWENLAISPLYAIICRVPRHVCSLPFKPALMRRSGPGYQFRALASAQCCLHIVQPCDTLPCDACASIPCVLAVRKRFENRSPPANLKVNKSEFVKSTYFKKESSLMRKLLLCIPYFFSFKPSRNASPTRSVTL